MSRRPKLKKNTSLEQWRIIFLCRLFRLIIIWLVAVFSLAVLCGLHVISLTYGSSGVLAGTTGGVFGLFAITLRWLFQKRPH